MTIHWKAVEQYFTVVLFVNPLTPRVKPWVIQSFLTFDSMDRTLILENLLILDFELSGAKGLMNSLGNLLGLVEVDNPALLVWCDGYNMLAACFMFQ